ncbi:uncharacterized protein LOC134268389 [Saccostrea cucullata]
MEYHCLPTENFTILVEVCTKTKFLQGVCPYYDSVGKSIQMSAKSCQSAKIPCPARYPSNTTYIYTSCYPSIFVTGGAEKRTVSGMHFWKTILLMIPIYLLYITGYHDI